MLDLILPCYFLAPLYEENAALWRPFHQMNVALIHIVTVLLIAVFLDTSLLLIRPKSLRTGLAMRPNDGCSAHAR